MASVSLPDKTSTSLMYFISHDSRDHALAEAFSKLLFNASTGILECFRSSDNRGTQGIEYGVPWYDAIITKLNESVGTICLLTYHSINKPWILFESGISIGKSGPPLKGIALGITLEEANVGPFAQFQLCSDDADALTKLVTELVQRIPHTKPNEDIIKPHVEKFLISIKPVLDSTRNKNDAEKTSKKKNDNEDNSEITKLYEEVKKMFQELPNKLQREEPAQDAYKELMQNILDKIKEQKLPTIDLKDDLKPLKDILGDVQKTLKRMEEENTNRKKQEKAITTLPSNSILNSVEQFEKNLQGLKLSLIEHMKSLENKIEITEFAEKARRQNSEKLIFQPLVQFLKSISTSYEDFLNNATEIERFYYIIIKDKRINRKDFLNAISSFDSSQIIEAQKI